MVKVEQIYTGCVAEAAYFIESEGECCVIDPLRELKPYTQRAEAAGAKLKYIFETHFHADFVSGHCDLAKLTGATIVYGPLAEPQFPCHVAKDGEVFKIGGATITVLHTPGHTMESTCYLLHDEQGRHAGVFTGDTLFIGDVGRPDLAQKAANLTTEQLAEHLYRSLRTKIMTLPDDIIVYPGHGAGSPCGKNLSSQTTDTLGHQKATNYALRANMTIDEFTTELLHGLTAPPSYFPLAVAKNKQAPTKSFDAIMHLARTRVSPQQLYKLLNGPNPPLVIDTRTVPEFCKSHIRGTVFTGIDDGSFAPWIATAIGNVDIPYVLIPSTDAKVKEAVTRLSRFGFDNPIGYLHGGFKAWLDAGYPTDSFETVSADGLFQRLKADPNLYLVDVRNPGEWNNSHHPRAVSIRLNAPNLNDVDPSKTIYAHCRAGYRSCIFLSLVRRVHGPHVRVVNVEGGFDAMAAHPGLAKELVQAPCASKAKQQQCSAGTTPCSSTPKSKL